MFKKFKNKHGQLFFFKLPTIWCPGGRRLHRLHPQNAFKEVEAEEAVENGGQVHPPLGQRPRPDHSLRHGLPGHPGEDRGDGPPPPLVHTWPPITTSCPPS